MSEENKSKSSYSEEIANIICDRISYGESLRTICKDADMPACSTVFKWLNDIDGFSEQYARARETQVEGLIDELVEIADEADQEAGAVAQAKLRIDTRKWFITKVAAKKYGDKVDVTSNGGSINTPTIIKLVSGNDDSDDSITT